jgi:DNA-binding MarR family transcriptional regulator
MIFTEDKMSNLYIFLMEVAIKKYRHSAKQAFQTAGVDITVDQWVVLKQVEEHHEATQIELAQYSVKDAPTTARIIDQLLRKGWVVKKDDIDDRRKYRICLTAEGEKIINMLLPYVMAYRKNAIQNFSPEELKIFVKLTQKMINNLVV